MTERYSSNAVLTKARAMYGRHLTKHNFNDLLSCHSVGEVASYLKNNTNYRKILMDVNESEIHRGRLEQLLRRKMFEDVAALCIYLSLIHIFLAQLRKATVGGIPSFPLLQRAHALLAHVPGC